MPEPISSRTDSKSINPGCFAAKSAILSEISSYPLLSLVRWDENITA